MTGRTGAVSALLGRGVAVIRRSSLWWGLGIVSLALTTAAFWPGLEGSDALQGFEDMGSLLEAFGAQDIATPAGYLDGQMYALMLPLLLSGMAIMHVSGLTSGDEGSGRLELLHALPVTRTQVWLTRWTSSSVVLLAVGAVTTAVMVASLPLFSLDEVPVDRVVTATLGCVLLALFHGAAAYAAAGFGAPRGASAGAAILVLVVGYVMSSLLPLADAFAGARHWSPWYWAIGQQPVTDGVSAAHWLLLVAITALLVTAGTVGVNRRDVRTA